MVSSIRRRLNAKNGDPNGLADIANATPTQPSLISPSRTARRAVPASTSPTKARDLVSGTVAADSTGILKRNNTTMQIKPPRTAQRGVVAAGTTPRTSRTPSASPRARRARRRRRRRTDGRGRRMRTLSLIARLRRRESRRRRGRRRIRLRRTRTRGRAGRRTSSLRTPRVDCTGRRGRRSRWRTAERTMRISSHINSR